MSRTLSANLADHLSQHNITGVVYISSFPTSTDPGVLIKDLGGTPSDRERGDYQRLFSIETFDLVHSEALRVAWDIYDLLNECGRTKIGKEMIVDAKAGQTPYSRGQDQSKRWRYACNYRVTLVRSRQPKLFVIGNLTTDPASIVATVT